MDGLIATGFPAFTGMDQLSNLSARKVPVHDRDGSMPVQALFVACKARLLTLAIPAVQDDPAATLLDTSGARIVAGGPGGGRLARGSTDA